MVDQAGATLSVSDVAHQSPNQSLDGRRALWPGPAKFFFCCACAWAFLDLLPVCLLVCLLACCPGKEEKGALKKAEKRSDGSNAVWWVRN